MTEDAKQVTMSVVAVLDLQGFANHLELANLDPRTEIGNVAVQRLDSLKAMLARVNEERATYPDEYPKFYHLRVNDMLMLAMDLPELFLPEVGAQESSGYRFNTLKEAIPEEEIWADEAKFIRRHSELIEKDSKALELFVGLVARIYWGIESLESSHHFPGVKCVISMGLRRKMTDENGEEDPLSLNLGFANSYLAGKDLKGSRFYLEAQVVRHLSWNIPSRYLAWCALHESRETPFRPLAPQSDDEFPRSARTRQLAEPIRVTLFRQEKFFYPANRSLCHMQFLNAFSTKKYSDETTKMLAHFISPVRDKDGNFVFRDLVLSAADLVNCPMSGLLQRKV